MYNQPETILEQYDLTVSQISKGRGNYICQTSEGTKILMPFRGSPEKGDFLRQSLSCLNSRGFEVEQILCTKTGESLATDDSGVRYLLKDKIEGVECNTKSMEEMQEAMELLAKFHNASADCDLPIPPFMQADKAGMRTLCEKHARELVKVKNYIRARKRKNEFECKFREQYDYFIEQANRAVEMLAGCEQDSGEYLLCHGDFNQHNVLKEKGTWRLINFEYMAYQLPMQDVANFLRKMLEKNNWSEKLGNALLSSYGKTRPLGEREYRQLYVFLLFPEKYWKIANHYYNSHKAWLSRRDIEKLDKVMAQENSRNCFLENLFSFLS